MTPASTSRPAIQVVRASKLYRRYAHRKQFATLKSALLTRSLISNLEPEETFTALNDVTVTVPAGRTLGVIGRNGSGKSTLLKLVAGITKPTSGTVTVAGRVSALIELGLVLFCITIIVNAAARLMILGTSGKASAHV